MTDSTSFTMLDDGSGDMLQAGSPADQHPAPGPRGDCVEASWSSPVVDDLSVLNETPANDLGIAEAATRRAASELELWGGIECTVLRVGDMWRDQLRESGHYHRIDDLEAVARLGFRKLRYPVLWEHVAPEQPGECDWRWHDERLARLRELGITPIAGLVHHGGGPHYTNLLDPNFPELLAEQAERTARRYPWIKSWTPVNEPLTTARFSGLYGHWFPHGTDEATFLRILANECRAVVLAMRAIRRVIPDAELVQTEDLGKTFSTPKLAYQAEDENERRWLSLDLLTGRVDRDHPWWRRLLAADVTEAELDEFRAQDLGPMVIGFNYYITSERFLDHRLALYPEHMHGGNGRDAYADIEAARVPLPPHEGTGWEPRLREAWDRYGSIPLAITEAHIGWCPEHEQVRWFLEAWDAAAGLRAEGADIRAVTIWSLLGAVDWNSLLTQKTGHYEPGVFDMRHPSGRPHPRLIAKAAEAIARQGRFEHPLLQQPGWWRREDRFLVPPKQAAG
ncbi:family 1 glycosylhydrolase [Belnapia rosea]|uniref:Beta-glucosidase/6-phospho-beta-glucosidase/beta-galactosidase n=1 Tax=Belnapia rosea TaxID=938405 RepID=A0A1G6VNC9_9PROT|nr:family 1 glycosylhydrolase [Belnapia rosea]SDD55034.1 Beta-glucosidase/6-phospho-beta-glucosidase/beta-galactosidase [Belnapia rosea]